MRTRKSTLELTPLLDVVLIILFVFMMLLAGKVNEATETKEQAQTQIAQANKNLESALDDITELQRQLEEATSENDLLKQLNEDSAAEIKRIQSIADEQQESAENLAKAISEFIGANQNDIKNLLDENDEESQSKLNAIMSAEDVAEELLKYEALSRQFYFIDLELKTSNNRLYINEQSTSVGISSDELGDDDYKQDKIDEIKNIIEEDLDKRQGGSQMVFISVKVHDRYVRQNAWQIVWDAVGEIQEKYGTDKIFRTQITIIKE